MTTTVIHSDVSGSMYSGVEFDYRKLKAIRKFIVFSTQTNLNDIILNSDGTEGLKVNTTTGAAASCPLGDRWIDPDSPLATNNTNAIVHPDDNELPLQTVDVVSLGEQRFLVTANFFTTPITWGGGGTVAQTMSLRTELVATRSFKDRETGVSRIPGNCKPPTSPLQYSIVTTVAQLKILIPFFVYKNPINTNNSVLGYLGGLNSAPVTIGGIAFPANQIRFDGISMDEFGSVVSSGSATYRFRGNYEFVARSDGFYEETVSPNNNNTQWILHSDRPSINHEGDWSNPYTELGLPQ